MKTLIALILIALAGVGCVSHQSKGRAGNGAALPNHSELIGVVFHQQGQANPWDFPQILAFLGVKLGDSREYVLTRLRSLSGEGVRIEVFGDDKRFVRLNIIEPKSGYEWSYFFRYDMAGGGLVGVNLANGYVRTREWDNTGVQNRR